MVEEIKVSVCCVTYNHEEFIRDAIEGFLMQKTDFQIEIIIRDDASTDGTAEIVREYHAAYPDLFRCIYHTQNQYSLGKKAFPEVFALARGKYIAMCEGDDYWTDPLKLQKQVDFLEAHPGCTSCFHDVNYRNDTSKITTSPFANSVQKDIYTIEDLLVKNVWTKTCSCLFINGLIAEFPDWYYGLKIGDWPLFTLLAHEGDIGYVHEVMAVYRVHASSIFSSVKEEEQYLAGIASRQAVNAHFMGQYRNVIMPEIFRFSYKLVTLYYAQGDIGSAKLYLKQCHNNIKFHGKIPLQVLMILFFKIYFPFLRRGKGKINLIYSDVGDKSRLNRILDMFKKILKKIYGRIVHKKSQLNQKPIDANARIEENARFMGVKIGKNCTINPCNFGSEPYLVSIGDHVGIATGVCFLTHDGSVWTLRDEYPDIDYIRPIIIHDNCMIGINAIILPGVTIGPNSVVGAGAIVTKNVPPNSIAVGVPARVIKTMEDFKPIVDKCLPTKLLRRDEKREYLLNYFGNSPEKWLEKMHELDKQQ
jgi:acetyltransferase-like isoleucine patch superfamily enzyme